MNEDIPNLINNYDDDNMLCKKLEYDENSNENTSNDFYGLHFENFVIKERSCSHTASEYFNGEFYKYWSIHPTKCWASDTGDSYIYQVNLFGNRDILDKEAE